MPRMISSVQTFGANVLAPTITGILYYIAAIIALNLSQGQDGIATVWPSSGILLAALLVSPRPIFGWHLLAAGIASLCANLELGNPGPMSAGFTLANLAESSIAALLIKYRANDSLSLSDPAQLIDFCIAAFVSTIVSASIAMWFIPTPSLLFCFSWFSTDLLGILLVTPLIMVTRAAIRKRGVRPSNRSLPDVIGIFAMVAGVCTLTFAQSTYPLLFLPMLAALIAVSRLGLAGAAGAVLIAGSIGSVSTSLGSGPIMLIAAGPQVKSLFFQFYLLSLFSASLPIGALLATRRKLLGQLSESVRLLQLAESTGQLGHWRLDVKSETVTWSKQVFQIHGLDGDRPPLLEEAILAYHPDDRNMVSEMLTHAIQGQHGFEFVARILRPDGSQRHVLSRGEYDEDVLSRSVGLFGIIQDITAQVEHEQALKTASLSAERAAAEAKAMAETDQLTGIANRRRVSMALEQEIRQSELNATPLAMAIFDIDHFKQINDRFGHHTGDDVIKRVAGDAARQLRKADILGRFGGEEFVIVFPVTLLHDATKVAERVRKAVERSGQDPAVTISIGVAERLPGEKADALLRRADAALYRAKSSGRNLLRLAS